MANNMNLSIKYGTEHLVWIEVCEIFRLAPLGTRDPKKLQLAAENSYAVVSAFADEKLVGFGRTISDGQYQSAIYDIVVLPEFQRKGIGRTIMNALLEKLPQKTTVLIFVAPGKQPFYEKFGFGNLKTGMGLFPNPEMSRAKGYLE
jgi:ribosomal protein S18 acetylase RimI-like enzyme